MFRYLLLLVVFASMLSLLTGRGHAYNYQDGYDPYVTPYLKGYEKHGDYTYYDSRNLKESWNNTNSNSPPY